MAALALRLLGDFEARDGAGRALDVKSRKNRALIAVLALAPSSSLPRELIASLLWSDRGEEQARASLRQALASLRKDFAAIDPPLLTVNDVKVKVDLARLDVDVLTFLRLADSDAVEALRHAAALYRGELLADTYLRDAAFEEWVSRERRRLADVASNVLEKLCGLESGAARIDAAKRLVALDRSREASHRKLMEVYYEAGEKGLALRQYETCRGMLRDEFDAGPAEETEALRQRLLLNGSASARPAANGESSFAALPEVRPVLDRKPAIAVLPFEVLGGDAELEHFSNGLTEDIITGLSRISAIKVIARTTMMAYKGRTADIRDIGAELDARYILEGSVRSSGTRLRVVAQLIETLSGHHIWAEKIERDHADKFQLQDDVAKIIVASAQTQLILNEGKTLASGGAPPGRVSHLLARSWQRFLGLTEESLADSKALAERALALDDQSGMAHRMLAVALYHQVYMGFVPWTAEIVDEVYAHARASIELEDADEYCHWAMECAHLLKKQHERAVGSLHRALEINPHCSLVQGSMGTVLAWAGDQDESIRNNELALLINPQDPSTFFRHFGLGLAHYLASRYEKALAHAGVVSQTRPAWWLGQIVYSASLAQLGRLEDARRILDELRAGRPRLDAGFLSVLPFANPRDRDHLLDGLRKAGLPD
ncbi:BTAD domain-containing putative transcriptional regulator [soil metagenome]